MDRGKTEEALALADSCHARTMMERLSLTQGRERRTDFKKLAARYSQHAFGLLARRRPSPISGSSHLK